MLLSSLSSSSIQLLVLVVEHSSGGTCWLLFEWMDFAIGQEEWLAGVLMVMGQCAVSLGDVEAEHAEGKGAHELLLE